MQRIHIFFVTSMGKIWTLYRDFFILSEPIRRVCVSAFVRTTVESALDQREAFFSTKTAMCSPLSLSLSTVDLEQISHRT